MTTKTTTKAAKSTLAARSRAKSFSLPGRANRFVLEITLESPSIGQFGIARTKRKYRHGFGKGPYGETATTLAAARAEADEALPNFEPILGDHWDAKALFLQAARIADWVKHMDAGSFNAAEQIQIAGGNLLAREIAVQIGRVDAADEGNLFMKIWLCLDWTEAVDVPHSASIANYLDQMISRDCATLDLNETEFREKAFRIIAGLRH